MKKQLYTLIADYGHGDNGIREYHLTESEAIKAFNRIIKRPK